MVAKGYEKRLDKLIAQATDLRFFRQLAAELKA